MIPKSQPKKQATLPFNIKYKTPNFVCFDHTIPDITRISTCREVFCMWTRVIVEKSVPKTLPFCIFFKTLDTNVIAFIKKIKNTMIKVEKTLEINSGFTIQNIEDLVKKGAGVRGYHFFVKIEIGNAWFKSPVHLSLYLLFLKTICEHIQDVPKIGWDYDELVEHINYTCIGDSGLVLLRNKKEVLSFINNRIINSVKHIPSNYNKPFGYGFLNFINDYSEEISSLSC